MILGFKRHWPKEMGDLYGKPTLFPEKIWTGAALEYIEQIDSIEGAYYAEFGWPEEGVCPYPKYHSIREGDRWRKFFAKHGEKAMIQFYVAVRTARMFQIAPDMPVKMVDSISIEYPSTHDVVEVCINNRTIYTCRLIESELMEHHGLNFLANNDGFDNAVDFFKWFNKDFEGEIVHWTDLINY